MLELNKKEINRKAFDCYSAVIAGRGVHFLKGIDDNLLWCIYQKVGKDLKKVRKQYDKKDPSRPIVGGLVRTFITLGRERRKRTNLPNEVTEGMQGKGEYKWLKSSIKDSRYGFGKPMQGEALQRAIERGYILRF